MSVDQVSLFAALLAVIAAVIAAVGGAMLITRQGRIRLAKFRYELRQVAFFIATTATAGSLWFSEVGGFVPCEYCWYQRIAMYPLVVVLGLASWPSKGEGGSGLRWRALPFSLAGLCLSGYHVQLQWFPNQRSFCEVSTPCTQQWINEFGFMSIPMMALCGFAAVTVLVLAATVREDAYVEEESWAC